MMLQSSVIFYPLAEDCLPPTSQTLMLSSINK